MKTTVQIPFNFKNYKQKFLKLRNDNRFSRLGRTFQTETNKYFYDAGTGKVFQINNNVYKVLCCLSSTDDFDKLFDLDLSLNELVDSLRKIEEAVKDENILLMPPIENMVLNQQKDEKLENIQMRHISLEITERCNLQCKYCIYHEGQGGFRNFGRKDISFDTIKKAIDLLSLSKEDEVYISFYGGEPLLRFDLIKQCILYCNEKLNNKTVYYNMTTNGTLMTKEIADYLSTVNNYFTTISLDGPEFIHDKNRVFNDGSGSFKKVMEGLKMLIKAEGDKASERINFNIVLENPEIETFDVIQNFFDTNEWIPNDIDITTSYVSSGDIDYEYLGVDTEKERKLTREYNDPLIDWNIQKVKSGLNFLDENTLISKDFINKELNFIHKRSLTEEPVKYHRMNGCCVPGARRLYVTVNGDFAVCERIGPSPYIGNVNEGLDFDKIKKHYITDFINEASKFCNDCWAVSLCGLCYINCYDKNGIHISYRHGHCVANRRVLENTLIQYHKILENDPTSLDYLNKIIYS